MMKLALVLVLLVAATVTADDTTPETPGEDGTDESEGPCQIDGLTYQVLTFLLVVTT